MSETRMPNSWKFTSFGEVIVGKPQYGLTARSSTTEGDVVYLRISDVTDDGELNTEDLHFIDANSAKLSKYELHENDFLIARSGSVGRVYLFKDLKRPAVFASYLIRFKLDLSKVIPKFVLYWGLSPNFKAEIEVRRKVVAQPNINAKDYSRFRFPLPPLETQRIAVSVLERINRLGHLRNQANQLTSKIIQSVFLKLFGAPSINPKKWDLVTIGDIVTETQYGLSKGLSDDPTYVPIVRMSNVTVDGHLDMSEMRYVEIGAKEFGKYRLHTGDVLFNRTNSRELVGKTGLVTTQQNFVFASYLIRVRTRLELATPEYLWTLLNSGYGKETLLRKARGAVGQANINSQELRAIKLPLPPIELQRRLSSIIQRLESLRTKQTLSTQETKDLFRSLMYKAFRGELSIPKAPIESS